MRVSARGQAEEHAPGRKVMARGKAKKSHMELLKFLGIVYCGPAGGKEKSWWVECLVEWVGW